jgi:hypothetical protein
MLDRFTRVGLWRSRRSPTRPRLATPAGTVLPPPDYPDPTLAMPLPRQSASSRARASPSSAFAWRRPVPVSSSRTDVAGAATREARAGPGSRQPGNGDGRGVGRIDPSGRRQRGDALGPRCASRGRNPKHYSKRAQTIARSGVVRSAGSLSYTTLGGGSASASSVSRRPAPWRSIGSFSPEPSGSVLSSARGGPGGRCADR